jgi:AcrR family transcriptional regulator
LISSALHKGDAIAALAAIILGADNKLLDENAAVGLTDTMGKAGKSASKKKSAAIGAAGDDESARGRLLSAATHLFCKNGINATGIDAIIDEAGTAKTTLYKLFGSKTNLVHAVLESEGKQWREWFIGAIESGGGDAETKLARIFPALKSWFGEERFYGCPFINAVGEHDKDQKQFRNIALKHKKVVLAHIEKLAAEMGASEPDVLAHQLALLIDGAIVAAMVSRNPSVADTAGLAACSLFEPAKAKKSKRAAATAQLVAV